LPDNDRRTQERRSGDDRRAGAATRQRGPFTDRRRRRLQRALYKLLFAGMIDMDFRAIRRHVYLLIVVAFELVVLFIWWSALLDLPRWFYGTPPQHFSWQQPTMETVWMTLLLLFVLAVLRVFFKQIRYLEGFLPVCSVCKSIRVGDRWVPLEQFLHEHSDVRMTHSLCGPCAKKYYDYDEGEGG